MAEGDEPVQMHADEILTDAALVRELLAAQFPHWADLPIVRVPSAGTDNAMYRLGTDLVVRLPRIGWAVKDVAHEQHWLPKLAPVLPVDVPVPLAAGAPTAFYPYPWSVYRWIDGTPPVAGALHDPQQFTDDLVQLLLAFQRMRLPDGPPASRNGELWRRDGVVRAAIAALPADLDAAAITRLWEATMAVPEWDGPPVWLHPDLAPGNLLLRNNRLAAVIDLAGVGVGDPACHLPVAWNLLPANMRPRFRTLVQADDATWERGRGWALSVALLQLPYYLHTNPPLVASSRRVIGELLAEQAHS